MSRFSHLPGPVLGLFDSGRRRRSTRTTDEIKRSLIDPPLLRGANLNVELEDRGLPVSDSISKRIAGEIEANIYAALSENDWETYPILDFVRYHSEPRLRETDDGQDRYQVSLPSLVVRRYRETPPAPAEAVSAPNGVSHSVQRWTRPLYERMDEKYPEAFERARYFYEDTPPEDGVTYVTISEIYQ